MNIDKGSGQTKKRRVRDTTTDVELRYATRIDPKLEQWRALAAEWLTRQKRGKGTPMHVMRLFLVSYIHETGLATDPAVFLRAGYAAPCLYATCLSHLATKHLIIKLYNYLSQFIDYVLVNHFSGEDDFGKRVVPPEFRNPIPELPEAVNGHRGENQESDKNILPYLFIRELRDILCPTGAKHFWDWKWVWCNPENGSGANGDWFVVPFELIDQTDPDCVWGAGEPTLWEKKKFGYSGIVYRLWSPVRAVALYLKLQLPLRTYQVRMLDSGEADTWCYNNGHWVRNTGPLAQGTEKNPYRRSVFRRMKDNLTRVEMTGLFINTNKTADLGKDEWSKGYEVPWQHEQAIYWLEKLRNWQAKYNPISAPTPWTSLQNKHFGGELKAESTLKAMGSTCFLFRDASAIDPSDRCKPVGDMPLRLIWFKLLHELENLCEKRKDTLPGGGKLVFVKPGNPNGPTSYFPLHSLRVSLITAYALEGGVPMPILSRCIAGHARLIMTLYYTKPGIAYVTGKLNEAEKRCLEDEQASYARWARDAAYKDLEAYGVYVDPAAIQAVLYAQTSGASLIKDDKGICPKGALGCDSGGVYVNDDSGKTSYGPVPGYPQKNCPRCRWFFTGPAFLPGLENHWNFVHLQMGEVGERIITLEGQIIALEDEQYECQKNDQPFLNQDKLNTLRKIHQSEIQQNDKLANDSSATFRLIARCIALVETPQAGDGISLVASGSLPDVQIAIKECGRLEQILTAVAGSIVFPEHDVRKAALQAGQAYDMMLKMNGKEPVCFTLSEDELLPVVQHTTRLLQAEAGSLENALPFIEGIHRLAEFGIDFDMKQLVQDATKSHYVQLHPVRSQKPKLVSCLPSATDKSGEEVSNA